MNLAELTQAYRKRSSIRAYDSSQPLDKTELSALFEAAQQAPSWCNIQPWKIQLTAPATTKKLSEALVKECTSAVPTPDIPFPGQYPEPYLAKRRACGGALYGAMGIERQDKKGRWAAWLRNYEVFDAPHLAVVSREHVLGEYATLDVGVWLGFLFSAAAVANIDMCAMASIAAYPKVLRTHLDIPENDIILFGIAIGRRKDTAPANRCKTDRDPISSAVTFVGFES